MRMKFLGGRTTLVVDTVLFLATVALLSYLIRAVSPAIENVRITVDGRAYPASLPVAVDAHERNRFTIAFTLHMPKAAIGVFRVKIDDCAQPMHIGTMKFRRFCEGSYDRGFDLGNALATGPNEVSGTVKDVYGSMMQFDLRPRNGDIVFVFSALGIFLVTLWYVLSLLRYFAAGRSWYTLGRLFVTGCLLRIGYVLATPYYLRAYDVPGHLSYIKYVADFLRLPPSQEGYEWQQAPLYYLLTGGWIRLNELLGRGWAFAFHDLQLISLLLSVATLFVGILIARELFGEKKEGLLFAGMLAVFPGFVLFSSRVSNDALFQLAAFVFVLQMLRWWKSGTDRNWYLLAIITALGVLTKGSGYLLVYCALFALLVKQGTAIRHKLASTLRFAGIFILLTGWFPLYRFLTEVDPDVFPFNFGSFADKASIGIPTHLSDFLLFNPFTVIMIPFSTPGIDTYSVRFWEFLLRTMFFGQYEFLSATFSAQVLLLASLTILLPLCIAGVWRVIQRRDTFILPMLILAGTFLLAAILGRIRIQCACGGDFRLVLPLLIPIAYVFAIGSTILPRRWQASAWAFVVCCGIFLLHPILSL